MDSMNFSLPPPTFPLYSPISRFFRWTKISKKISARIQDRKKFAEKICLIHRNAFSFLFISFQLLTFVPLHSKNKFAVLLYSKYKFVPLFSFFVIQVSFKLVKCSLSLCLKNNHAAVIKPAKNCRWENFRMYFFNFSQTKFQKIFSNINVCQMMFYVYKPTMQIK
jgi:hypothetical protein